MTDLAGIPALIEAIRHMHDCEATWVETTHVRAPAGGHEPSRIASSFTAAARAAWSAMAALMPRRLNSDG
jgi:hypothetical protein